MKKYELVALFRQPELDEQAQAQIVRAFENGDFSEYEIAAAQYVAQLFNTPKAEPSSAPVKGKWITEWLAKNAGYKGEEL